MTSSPTAISCCIACLRIWHRRKCEHSLPGYAAGMWLAARIYRVGMLMYGKKPTFAELAKWIRYA